MYAQTLEHFSNLAAQKTRLLKSSPSAFFIASMMAGAYVGMGIILIFSLGATADEAYRSLIMGTSFGIALTLVVFAGSELFTGHTMYMPLGWLARRIGATDVAATWTATWVGNLAGAFVLAALVAAGGGILTNEGAAFLNKVAAYKMNSPAGELVARSILCNWLVCLALWMSARTTSDTAKCIIIFWCLLAFIASGFEHSVANMTIFSVALLGQHPVSVSVTGAAHNLLWVTIGNAISGAIFMALGYWHASGPKKPSD